MKGGCNSALGYVNSTLRRQGGESCRRDLTPISSWSVMSSMRDFQHHVVGLGVKEEAIHDWHVRWISPQVIILTIWMKCGFLTTIHNQNGQIISIHFRFFSSVPRVNRKWCAQHLLKLRNKEKSYSIWFAWKCNDMSTFKTSNYWE